MATESRSARSWAHNTGIELQAIRPEYDGMPPDGLPRTARFLAADPDHTTAVFRRFHETSVRSLLFLEGRVAALQEVRDSLDDISRKDPDVRFANRAWEVSCLLGSWGSQDNGGVEIPKSAFEFWAKKWAGESYKPGVTLEGIQAERESLRSASEQGTRQMPAGSPRTGPEDPPGTSSTMVDSDKRNIGLQFARGNPPGSLAPTRSNEARPPVPAEDQPPTFSFAERETRERLQIRELIIEKWRLDLAINAALKEYRKSPYYQMIQETRQNNCKLIHPFRRSSVAIQRNT